MLSTKPFAIPKALLSTAQNHHAARAVVVGADHPRAMEGVKDAVDLGLIDPILVGDAEGIQTHAKAFGLALDGIEMIQAQGDDALAEAGAMRAADPAIDIVVKGQVHTDALMSALLKPDANIRVGRRLTHCFSMTVPGDDKPLMITDAAVNVAPDIKTRQACILNAVDLALAVGIKRPKVALLSATESVLPQMPSSVEAAELTEWAGIEVSQADVYGPLAFDNAVSIDAAKLKGIDHPVAGAADILVVPNIETGNGLFKMMVYFMSATAAGVVLGGRIPIVLTSRADPAEARIASIALARVYAARDA